MISLYPGDNRETLRRLIDEGVRVHSVVTDPPYGLTSVVKRFGKEGSAPALHGTDGAFARASAGFMGKLWDGSGIERDPEFWRLIWEILLPGGFVFAFSGSRTGHWQACAMETAGFIMHPMTGWVYHCLDAETLAATPSGDKPYTSLKIGDEVICYDPSTGEYSVEPILEIVKYDYDDTAFRIVGDNTDQIVTRNHRCIVERGGKEVFKVAETLEQQESVPFLEDLRDLREAFSVREFKGCESSHLQSRVPQNSLLARSSDANCPARSETRGSDYLPGMRVSEVGSECVATEGEDAALQQAMQWKNKGETPSQKLPVSRPQMVGTAARNAQGEDARRQEPILEWGSDSAQKKRSVRSSDDTASKVSGKPETDGGKERICDGASPDRGQGYRAPVAADGSRTSYQSHCHGQSADQSNVVQQSVGPQVVRAWPGHKTDLVRIVPFHHVGKVWCLRVRTGAFVAVRNGLAFPTGNSGMPKAHDAAKAIDKHLGVQGSVVPQGNPVKRMIPDADQYNTGSWIKDNGRTYQPGVYMPGSDEALQWDGWAYGTATQKPALEPIYLGQKPFSEKTGAANLLKHGVGAMNIDDCRVPTDENLNVPGKTTGLDFVQPEGRWPANLILDGSVDVLSLFPDTGKSTGGRIGKKSQSTVSIAPVGQYEKGDPGYGDSGSSARFYHQFHHTQEDLSMNPIICHPKAGKADRAGSLHPTVKPVALMQYLIRHITPPGGTVLDPFAGSGTTGEAAKREGFDCILMEAEPEYLDFLRQRFGNNLSAKQRAIDSALLDIL